MARELLVYFDQTRDPIINLKREAELFEEVEGGTPEVARFWVNSPCLIRGEAKNSRYGWYNEDLAREMGMPVLTRSTGGGVVYHDGGNLNWSLFLRKSDAVLSPQLLFQQASRYVVEALHGFRLKAHFSPPNRIDVSDRKVSGLAARTTRRTQLVHGTLLLDTDLEKLNRLCIPPSGCPPVANLSEWVKGIDAPTFVSTMVGVLKESGFDVRSMDRIA
jgi:lipoate---protein ligase